MKSPTPFGEKTQFDVIGIRGYMQSSRTRMTYNKTNQVCISRRGNLYASIWSKEPTIVIAE